MLCKCENQSRYGSSNCYAMSSGIGSGITVNCLPAFLSIRALQVTYMQRSTFQRPKAVVVISPCPFLQMGMSSPAQRTSDPLAPPT